MGCSSVLLRVSRRLPWVRDRVPPGHVAVAHLARCLLHLSTLGRARGISVRMHTGSCLALRTRKHVVGWVRRFVLVLRRSFAVHHPPPPLHVSPNVLVRARPTPLAAPRATSGTGRRLWKAEMGSRQ